jgi:hypothetical protein
MKRFLRLGWMVLLILIWTGCGDTFRPIIIPNPPTFPDPRAAHTVLAVNDNGSISRGSVLVVDVSGDSEVSIADVGVAPVHAVQQAANQVLVLNQATTAASTNSLSKVFFSGTVINGSPTSISLPPNSAPNFVATTESNQAYVLLPSYVPDPVNNPNQIVPSVGVVSTASNQLIATAPVGNTPWAMVETVDAKKLYVANKGDSTISGFNTVDRSLRNNPLLITNSPPVWLSARSDSQRVYVLEANGTLAWLDTTSTAGPDTLTEEPTISVPGATIMLYDGKLNRLYIPGGSQMAIVDVSQSAPQLLKTILIPQIPSLPPVDAFAVAVAALPDGSRAYVASVSTKPQPSQVSISAVQGDGTNATYAYTLTGGHDLTAGIAIAVSGITAPDGFNGAFTIAAVSGTSCDTQVCTFQAANTTVSAQTTVTGLGSSTIDHLFPQVTVINTSGNTIKTTTGVAGFPDATTPSSPYFVPVCASTRFRFTMAAGGDSSRAYLAACDGGGINVIDTSTDSFLVNLRAPFSARPPIPPSAQQPPQNPVFLIAGP